MKILITSCDFYPGISGPATYLRYLTQELMKRGHQIGVITFGDSSNEVFDSFYVKRIPRRWPTLFRLLSFIYYLFSQGRRYDVWYVNDYGIPSSIINKILRKPIIMKIAGDFAWEYSITHNLVRDNIDDFQVKKYSPRVELMKSIQRFYVKNAKVIITPGNYLKKMISNWGIEEEKIKVINNFIDIDRYSRPMSRNDAKKKIGINRKIILTIARLKPWKGIDMVIDAVSKILNEGMDVRYLIIGDGSERNNLIVQSQKLGIDDRIYFKGEISRDMIPLYLKAADILVLYSGYEGLSHVLLEAMASGVPIVASRKGGNPELVDDGINGFLVEYGDIQGLKKAILQILDDEDMALRFGKASKEKIKDYDIGILAKKTIEVIEDGYRNF
ncbi:MAG: glycosyltransferase family 4 protein [Nitrospirota bacterium]